MNEIEVLFFEGCPHAELAIARAREAAAGWCTVTVRSGRKKDVPS